jgi:hypothetical protein
MTAAMGGWGGYELSRRLSLGMRDRELVIDRTCARCRCYHAISFTANGARVGLEDGAPRFADVS